MENVETSVKDYVSYSELRVWDFCPYYHKLFYLDKVAPDNYSGPITAGPFGTAMHHVCENLVQGQLLSPESRLEAFLSTFAKECDLLDPKSKETLLEASESQKIDEQKLQWASIFDDILPSLKEYFGEYEVIAVELPLMEPIEGGKGWKFKGFIDLVIKTIDGKYHIIDFKTTSWGWKPEKKGDKMTTYQLTLYKIFFSQKNNVPLEDIETHFVLLKRTAKTKRVEPFRVTSGPKKIDNAKNFLLMALHNIQNRRYIKKRLKCSECKIHKTEMCK